LDCGDGLDDDGDGLADCIDADCTSATECTNLTGACSNETDGNVFYGGTYVGAFSCLPRAPFQEPLVAPCVIAQTGLSLACADCMAAYVICVASSANDNACTQAVRDCSGIPFVVGETCGNGVDDDGNRQVDCVDSDCSTEPECQLGAVAEVCTDGTDNDGDSLIDCRDFDCAVACIGVPENCSDGFDDNGNGVRDCYETSCASDPSCTEEICGNGLDDNGNGSTDCADDDCAGAAACVESVCDDSSDNDSDGLTDCGDDDCAGAAACVESVCDDSTDNDGDGLTDCADADCFDQLSEDADDGSVPSDWTTSADTATTAAWGFTTVGALAGNSLRSGVIPDSGVSELTIPSPNRGAGRITFWWKTDTERSYDFFSVLFGTTLTWTRQSGVNAWSQTTLTVPANTPSITFRYSKDGSDLSGADAVWVDQIAWVAGAATCFPELCGNSIDDNANGLVDCADSDCADAVGCVETACNDYRDDEGDGAVDCLDSDCEGSVQCQEICDDEVDNDGDGLVDCFDVACRGSAACPVQRCLGVAFPGATAPYSGYRYGYSPTGCAPGEGCSLRIPGEPSTYGSWGGQQLYAGVCSAARTSGQSCGIGSAAGYCGDSTHGAGCMGGLCRGGEVPSSYGPGSCGAGQTALSALAADGSAYSFCAPVALGAASGESCGESVTKYCTGVLECRSLDSLAPTRSLGICVGSASSPAACPAGTAWRYEWSSSAGRKGLCLPYAGAGEACSSATLCDASAGLVCGSGGTCRPVVLGEGCASATALLPNTTGVGPDYFFVDRLDGLTEADESLNCSGTVGPEKVYFYTATSSVELAIEVGSVDGNGPLLSWYGRKETCTDIFAEAACGNASLLPTSGKIRLQAGETVYLTVDSAARWAGGDSAAAEFYLTVSERPVASEGGSCAAAVCDEGLNCAPSGICAVPSCGDALVDTGETCDDGNAVDGDGCTDCNPDVYVETEPNDTQGTANRVGLARRVSGSSPYERDHYCAPLGPHGGRITIRNISTGSCTFYLNDVGLFCGVERTLTFTTPEGCFNVYGYSSDPYLLELKVEPFAELGEGESCGPTLATGAACADIGGAPAVCLENSPRVHAGTCELSTCGDGYTDTAEGEQCDDGNTTAADGCSSTCLQETYNEVEPNNGNLTARNIGGYRRIAGAFGATTDFDYFKVTLAERSHLEFTVDSLAFGAGSASVSVELTSALSTVVFSELLDTYTGYGGARYGGRAGGYVNRAQALAFVEPGTYSLRLAAGGTATGNYVISIRDVPTSVAPIGAACDPLTYKPCLDGLQCGLSTRTCATPVCGDGVNTVDEACDDGNSVVGDGCDASCAVESLAFEQLSTDSRTPTSLTGIGTEYPFSDGSVVRVIELANMASYERYVSFELAEPTRVRGYNLSGLRLWQTGSGTDLSPVGTQVFAPGSYLQIVAPAWLGPMISTPAATNWDCDGIGEDGFCQDATGGTDCMDCGARFGVDPGSKYGYDLVLPEGTYTLKLTWDGSGRSIWLVLGESPDERAQ
jgi:cysteine-rich repeat protein